MIKISVDEGYAFDFLSILTIKKDKTTNRQAGVYAFDTALSIIEQLGVTRYSEIIASREYKNLNKANELVFDLINKIRDGDDSISANQVDTANNLRFECKKDLQKRFFNTETKEIKI
jgi:hypothetical protein